MIEILLSTYNGEKYLEEQIQSIINQTYKDWKLLIRDDASTDKTLEIINLYITNHKGKISKIEDTLGNIGVVGSFQVLLEQSSSEYIMLCDQDDVWLPEKIEKTFLAMQQAKDKYPNKPILVCTDLKVVQKELQHIEESMWKCAKVDPQTLKSSLNYLSVCNFVAGCTIMINIEARKIAMPFDNTATIHDHWIAMKILLYNGIIVPIYEQTILYRQHESNKYGVKIYGDDYLLDKIKNIKSVIISNIANFKMINAIRKTSIFTYLKFKLKYFIKRQKI